MVGVKAWITVNGNHIPIMDGESKMEAVGRFIKYKKAVKMQQKSSEYGEQSRQNKSTEAGKQYMEEKYGKNWNRYSDKDIKGRAKTKEEKYNDINNEYSKKVKAADQMYNNKPLKDWAELESNRKFYNSALQKAEHEREERLTNERIFKTDRYKLKEDKPAKTSRSKTIRDTNLRVGDTFKNHAGRVASHEAKIIKFKDGKYGLQISGVDGKPYRNIKYASIYQLEDDLKKQGYKYKKDW